MKKVFPQYLDKTLDNFEATTPNLEKAVKVTRNYIDNLKEMKDQGRGITFVGENGVGKTHLACAVLSAVRSPDRDQWLTRKPVSIECIELATWIDLWQETFKLSGEDERYHYISDQLRYVKRVSFLLLDDLGREHESVSGWSNERVFDLLRYRHNRCLPTLITTNIPIENGDAPMDLKRRYSEGMSSFLNGTSVIFEMEGEDYRCAVDR